MNTITTPRFSIKRVELLIKRNFTNRWLYLLFISLGAGVLFLFLKFLPLIFGLSYHDWLSLLNDSPLNLFYYNAYGLLTIGLIFSQCHYSVWRCQHGNFHALPAKNVEKWLSCIIGSLIVLLLVYAVMYLIDGVMALAFDADMPHTFFRKVLATNQERIAEVSLKNENFSAVFFNTSQNRALFIATMLLSFLYQLEAFMYTASRFKKIGHGIITYTIINMGFAYLVMWIISTLIKRMEMQTTENVVTMLYIVFISFESIFALIFAYLHYRSIKKQ